MVLTINPAVCGGRRLWVRDMLLFFGGAVGGAFASLAVASLVVAGIGLLGTSLQSRAVAASLLYVAVRDFGFRVTVPYRSAQVPEWLRRVVPSWMTALVYGAMLGGGFLTLYTFSSHFAMWASAPLVAGTFGMAAIAAAFAFGKTLVVMSAIGTVNLDQVEGRVRTSAAGQRILRLANGTLTILVAVVILTS
jgi:hypothetical protein